MVSCSEASASGQDLRWAVGGVQLLEVEEHPHFDRSQDWGNGWRLHCLGVIRRQYFPPACPDGLVIYEFYSVQPIAAGVPDLIVVWVAVPENESVAHKVLEHLPNRKSEDLISDWVRQIKTSVPCEMFIAFCDLGCPRVVPWTRQHAKAS